MDKSIADQLEHAFQQALPGHQNAVQQKVDEKSTKLGLMGVDPSAITNVANAVAGAQSSFCTAWPKTKGFINTALNMIGWLPGISSVAAEVKAVVSAIDSTVVPIVCPKK